MEEQNIEKPTRKIRSPHRYLEDGTYNYKPLDPNYFNIYYHKRTELVQCPKCGIKCRQNYLYKHSITNKCKKSIDASTYETQQLA